MGAGLWWCSVQKGWSNQGALILWKGWFLCLKCSLSLLGFSWQVQEEHQSLVYCAPNHVHQDPTDTLQASDQVGGKHYRRLTHMPTLRGSSGAFSERHKVSPGTRWVKPSLDSLTLFYLLLLLSSEILIHQKYLFRSLQSLQLCAAPFLSSQVEVKSCRLC